MKNEKVGIVLVGIGGYGILYVNEILEHIKEEKYELRGVVDPYPQNCQKYNELLEIGVPVFSTLNEFYKNSAADLAIISTPIQYHCANTCTALSNRSHVLCEKPVAATFQEVIQMMEQRDKAGKLVSIGYQWSHSEAILRLKKDILDGIFGKPLRMKSIVLWPRYWDYYERGWAGKKKDNSGNWVLDSVASNATAHYLHNMFYLLGDEINRSAVLKSVKAETYRANNIENYDTATIRAYTDKGVDILFLASHAIQPEAVRDPEFEYVFENGVISIGAEKNATIKAVLKDGKEIDYGNPFENSAAKFWTILGAIQNGTNIPCGLEAAATHTKCINSVQKSVPDAAEFPEDLICRDANRKITWVKGLADVLNKCYDEWKLPGELETLWASCGKEVPVDGLSG